jgi:hypothetical protein
MELKTQRKHRGDIPIKKCPADGSKRSEKKGK